jgi:HlyD family secretion protein.
MPRRLLPILILALGIGLFAALKATRPKPHPVQPSERIWRVQVTQVRPTTHRPILVLFGQVEAPDRILAAGGVGGRLLERGVRDGHRVAAGTLLARLDPRDLEPRLTKARADLDK